jgi:hypothetical protein
MARVDPSGSCIASTRSRGPPAPFAASCACGASRTAFIAAASASTDPAGTSQPLRVIDQFRNPCDRRRDHRPSQRQRLHQHHGQAFGKARPGPSRATPIGPRAPHRTRASPTAARAPTVPAARSAPPDPPVPSPSPITSMTKSCVSAMRAAASEQQGQPLLRAQPRDASQMPCGQPSRVPRRRACRKCGATAQRTTSNAVPVRRIDDQRMSWLRPKLETPGHEAGLGDLPRQVERQWRVEFVRAVRRETVGDPKQAAQRAAHDRNRICPKMDVDVPDIVLRHPLRTVRPPRRNRPARAR